MSLLLKRYKKYQYGSNMNDADEALQTGVNSAIQAGANAVVPGAGTIMQTGAGIVDAVAPPDKYGEQNKVASLIKGSFNGGTIGMIMAASSWKKQHERAMRLKDQESLNNTRMAEKQTAARVSSDPTTVSGDRGTLMNGYYAAGGNIGDPSGKLKPPTLKQIAAMSAPSKKPYEPTQAVKNTKATISAAQLATLPFYGTGVGALAGEGLGLINAVGDVYTGTRYMVDGQTKKGLLSLIHI